MHLHIKNLPAMKDRRRSLRRNQTEAEKVFWSKVRNKQIPGLKFFRQYSIGSYVLDFYCPAMKLAIELDGGQHADPDKMKYDAERSAFLGASGIFVMRFWNHDVLSKIEAVMEQLVQRIEMKNRTPPNLPLT